MHDLIDVKTLVTSGIGLLATQIVALVYAVVKVTHKTSHLEGRIDAKDRADALRDAAIHKLAESHTALTINYVRVEKDVNAAHEKIRDMRAYDSEEEES
jgi:hypothetical protein